MNGRQFKQKMIKQFEREIGLKHSRETNADFVAWTQRQPGLEQIMADPEPTGRTMTVEVEYSTVTSNFPAKR